jgi:hypothetical protein
LFRPRSLPLVLTKVGTQSRWRVPLQT